MMQEIDENNTQQRQYFYPSFANVITYVKLTNENIVVYCYATSSLVIINIQCSPFSSICDMKLAHFDWHPTKYNFGENKSNCYFANTTILDIAKRLHIKAFF